MNSLSQLPSRGRLWLRGASVALAIGMLALGFGSQPASSAGAIAVDSIVNSTATDGNCTLREAVMASNSDSAVDGCPAGSGIDTITLPAGTYVLTITGSSTTPAEKGDLEVTNSAILIGAGVDQTIIKAQAGVFDEGLFDVSAPSLEISGVTIQDFSATNVIYVQSASTLSASDCEFFSNDSLPISVNQGSAEIDACTFFQNNPTTSSPGAIDTYGGTLNVTNSTFLANHAGTGAPGGGAILLGGGTTVEITNSTFNSNAAEGDGGAILVGEATAYLENVTINQNYADWDIDGIGSGGGVALFPSGSATIANSIIAGNYDRTSPPPGDILRDCSAAGGSGNPFVSAGHNLIGRDSGCYGFTDGVNGDLVGTDANPIDPLLLVPDLNGGQVSNSSLELQVASARRRQPDRLQ